MRAPVTIQRLRDVLDYEPATGVLTTKIWRPRSAVGVVAGCVRADGYRSIWIDQQQFLAHRIIWALVTGEWPDVQIDHVNGLRDDNCWANLRLATNQQNSFNAKRQSRNTSGVKGVCLVTNSDRWRAYITVDGRQVSLGRFDTRDGAARARAAKLREMHGEFARVA